ncbi:exosome complex exonuclease RRP44 [Naegleria gruberi]|uniref:Ribosomal RNA-processing protein 44 n=1 Tax=Naegleria gruberi TaxID=5762 RepID=D2UXR9_NAEGR|nr:exosome complex exonuclease RRP44 [Naegleria gruberi]EFC50676.1 exosome complex exonuclease RRP44 [Naegleria gruberi]|eukprot:XP_002683420.1 exosome complex exonuclease RRP44 [Naegleria gruberi strain NEG-M]
MSLRSSTSFIKQTRKGNVVKVVREHYLRDDIGTGVGSSLQEDASCFIIPDTNVVLHQITILEHPSITNAIILQTVLNEVRNQNYNIYKRIRTLIEDKSGKHFYVFSNEHHRETYVGERQISESMNDRNDKAIRVTALWYMRKLAESKPIYLLTNDKENLRKAREMEITAKTIHDYVRECVSESNYPEELLDLLNYTDEIKDSDEMVDEEGNCQNKLFEDHLPMNTLLRRIKTKKLHQGRITVNRNNINEAFVSLRSMQELVVDLKGKNELKGVSDTKSAEEELGAIIGNSDATTETSENPILSTEVFNTVLIKNFKHMNRSIHGDIVAVEILPKSEWSRPSSITIMDDNDIDLENNHPLTGTSESDSSEKSLTSSFYSRFVNSERLIPTGKVVGIIKRNWRSYCGSLDEDTDSEEGLNKVLFVPVDRCIPKIRIVSRQCKELMNKRICVMIDGWSVNSKYPDGHYISTIGEIYNTDTESEVILLEHDVPHYKFSQSIIDCLPPKDWQPTEKDMERRRDLRHLNIVSVDPPGCTDIDDALHAIQLPDGSIEIGVHIADVTNFVKEGTAIDIEAAKRGTTVYLVDRRIEMLPSLLTNNLCSLRQHVDRLAFSVIWKFSPEGDIKSVDYTKSLIRSRKSMTYEEAQKVIDDKERDDELATDLRLLMQISKILKKKRNEAGSLTLASPAVKFSMEAESSNPTDVELYQLRETNSMVEEFMLLANIAVAKKITKEFPMVACLRRHPPVNPKKFEPLLEMLKRHGINLDISSSKILNETLSNIRSSGLIKDKYMDTLVRIMVTRCMEQAVYFISGDCSQEEYWHYGLAVPIYTHFTSPIRRYADVIVHRLLGAAIGYYPLTEKVTDREYSRRLMNDLNKRNRMSQYAQRSSVELYTNVYFNSNPITSERAYITQMKSNGIVVFIPRFGFEHVIFLTKDNVQYSNITFNEETDSLVFEDQNKPTITLTVFEHVNIRIYVKTSKNYRRKLCVEVVEPGIMKLGADFPYHIVNNQEVDAKTSKQKTLIIQKEKGMQRSTETANDDKKRKRKDELVQKLKKKK